MNAEFQFGEWLPDAPDYKSPGLEVCRNAIPSPNGFVPALAPEGRGISVSGVIIGSESFERSDGSQVIAVATTTDLHIVAGGIVTASTLSLSLSSLVDRVKFVRFGPSLYATTKNGGTWTLADIETDTAFVAASGSPPSANAMARVDEFLFMGDMVDIDASDAPYRLRWSQFNNPDGAWTTDKATQSGAWDMNPSQGKVMALSGGSFGLAFQKNGISRIDYTNGASPFFVDAFETNRGCAAGESVIRVGDKAYFLSYDGFFETDGSSVSPISRARIWEWFANEANQAFLHTVQGAVDWPNRCAVWTFSSNDAGTFDRQIYYNWETGGWGQAEVAVDRLVAAGRDGLSLEQVSVLYPDLDAMGISLDSPIFRARGRSLLSIVSGELCDMSGTFLAAEFGSGDAQPAIGKRTYLTSVTPLISCNDDNIKVSIGYKDKMSQSYFVTADVDTGSVGFAPFNHDSRYFRVHCKTVEGSGWSDAVGFQIEYSPSGGT